MHGRTHTTPTTPNPGSVPDTVHHIYGDTHTWCLRLFQLQIREVETDKFLLSDHPGLRNGRAFNRFLRSSRSCVVTPSGKVRKVTSRSLQGHFKVTSLGQFWVQQLSSVAIGHRQRLSCRSPERLKQETFKARSIKDREFMGSRRRWQENL